MESVYQGRRGGQRKLQLYASGPAFRLQWQQQPRASPRLIRQKEECHRPETLNSCLMRARRWIARAGFLRDVRAARFWLLIAFHRRRPELADHAPLPASWKMKIIALQAGSTD